MRIALPLLLCLLVAGGPGREDPVLEGRAPAMLRSFLEKKVKAAAARPIPEIREEFERDRAVQKRQLMRCLGLDPLPERTPLNPRVTGVIDGQGFRLEKIVFESRPRFPVTAHLYLPGDLSSGPFPVIINPHGHWRDKKMEPRVQKRAIAQARAGYAALVVDSPGASFEGDATIERRFAGSHFDLALIQGATNATTVYVWDLMRCIDYLATRSEADTSRVGITGTSGGGLATLYAFAADERFSCAVPVCYATSLEINPHNGCACNHVPGMLQVGDRSDVLAIRAPAPVFVIGASRDPEFPAEGTRRTGEKLKKIWALFDADDEALCEVFESGHDYSRPMREAALGFFDQHLRGIGSGDPVSEGEIDTALVDAASYICLPDPPERLLTMEQIARKQIHTDGEASLEDLIALNGGLPEAGSLAFETGVPRAAGKERTVRFESEPGLTIPGIERRPSGVLRGALVLLSDGGKRDALRSMPVEDLLSAGFACCALDVRGTGEFETIDQRLMAYLGTSIPFAQGWDAACAARIYRNLGVPVGVIGRGPCAAQAALHAALIERSIAFVAGLSGIACHDECFTGGAGPAAVQPRGCYAPPLERLRPLVSAPAVWTFGDEADPDLIALIDATFEEKNVKQRREK